MSIYALNSKDLNPKSVSHVTIYQLLSTAAQLYYLHCKNLHLKREEKNKREQLEYLDIDEPVSDLPYSNHFTLSVSFLSRCNKGNNFLNLVILGLLLNILNARHGLLCLPLADRL